MSKQDGIGTWVWKLPTDLELPDTGTYNFNFVSDSLSYTSIKFDSGAMFYGDTIVYAGGSFGNINNCTIVIETAPPSEFLTVLSSQATYQDPANSLLGTWIFKDVLSISSDELYELAFISNGSYYSNLETYSISNIEGATLSYDGSVTYSANGIGWENQAYRTITIVDTSTLTNRDSFVTFINANAELQGSAPSDSTKYKLLDQNDNLLEINGMSKGTLTYQGKTYEWDNGSTTPDPTPSSYYAMTIAGLGNEDPSTVTFTPSGAPFPTSFEEVTKDGDIFIKIPTMYRKVEKVVDNQITSFTIANAKVDSNYVPYPCFVRPDGTVAPYVLIGKTMCGEYCTPADGLTACRATGDGYYGYDIWTHKLFQDLELAMSKKVNYNDGSESITTAQMGLEALEEWYWIYGIIRSDDGWHVCYDPSKYVALADETAAIPSDYVKLGYAEPAADGYITKLGYDSAHPFANYPTTVDDSIDGTTHYCDYYGYLDGNRPVFCGVGDVSDDYYGLWYCVSDNDWSNDSGGGVRLCYRP